MHPLLIAAVLAVPWRWSTTDLPPTGDVTVRLIRGSVRVSVGPQGSVSVLAQRAGRTSDPAQIDLVVKRARGTIDIYARYPRYSGFEVLECLPPLDERGDFYHHDGRVDVQLTLPEGWRLHVEILEGDR